MKKLGKEAGPIAGCKGSRVTIERAAAADIREILSLQKLAYRSEAEIYGEFTIQPLTQTLDEIRAEFEDQVFLKASVNGQIIGSVRAYMKQEICLVGKLIVHPDFQNQGIGTQLIKKIEQRFNQAKRYELFTGRRSERNLHLYQKLGYKVFRSERITERLVLVFMEKQRSAWR